MSNSKTVFEYGKLLLETEQLKATVDNNRITTEQYTALQKFHTKNDNFFTLIHNGVKFNQFVGVLQVGNLTIEILPKLDKNESNTKLWRERLISMLKYVGLMKIHTPTTSALKVHHSSILDLYIEIFCREIEILLHKGLIKKYRMVESNQKTLKGALVFSKHIAKNVVHKELFFVRASTYDNQHIIHQILFEAIKVLGRMKISSTLHSLIGKIKLYFPEQATINVTQKTFAQIRYNRKTESYRNALMIARLILLEFHPDLSTGKNDILAILFDMNKLWEAYVTTFLRRNLGDGYRVTSQRSNEFCKFGKKSLSIKPDVYIEKDGNIIILDAKWKKVSSPSDLSSADMYQLYAYGKFYNCERVALVYPGNKGCFCGNFFQPKRKNDLTLSLIIDGGDFDDKNKPNLIRLKCWIEEKICPWK
jgi:5-methylcytosine-specific restriction enzyme subunit McrC